VPRDYRLYELSDAEFEGVVVQICVRWLGQGVTPFAQGKDGGRDAKFQGTAICFPSTTNPHSGHFVVQAKHVNERDRSCSDREFLKVLKGEYPKIKRLIAERICDHYIVFTNRRLTGGADEKLIKELMALKLRSAHIVGVERRHMALDEYAIIRDSLPNRYDALPFRFNPDDLKEVIGALHDYADDSAERAFDSARDFEKDPTQEREEPNQRPIGGLLSGDHRRGLDAPFRQN
jgi:hypothetical protein